MACFKKVWRDELLQLAIILSLLGADSNLYRRNMDYQSVGIGINDFGGGLSLENAHINHPLNNRNARMHPKSLDSVLLSYERDILEDLNALGRYNRIEPRIQNITAYILNLEGGSTSFAIPNGTLEILPTRSQSDELARPGSELTQEDMDLIEVLWKQDVDLGFSVEFFNNAGSSATAKEAAEDDKDSAQHLEKLKQLEASCSSSSPKDSGSSSDEEKDPWAGLSYTVDGETGEYVLQECSKSPGDQKAPSSSASPSPSLASQEDPLPSEDPLLPLRSAGKDSTDAAVPELADLVDLPDFQDDDDSPRTPSALVDFPEEFSLEETLQLFALDDSVNELSADVDAEDLKDDIIDDDFDLLSDVMPPLSRSALGRPPYGRAVSMEQRWQDLANLLSLPGPGPGGVAGDQPHMHPHLQHQQHAQHYGYEATNPARSVVLHNATLAPPVGDLNSSSVYPGLSMGNAVAQSMNLTNSSEPMGDVTPSVGYKMDSHDANMLYYQNSSSSASDLGQLGTLNSTTEGFLSAILNDEDLQLMDMMPESMYPMRMLESNNSNNGSSVSGMGVGSPSMGTSGPAPSAPLGATGPLGSTEERLDASSDSAVSSMGSERVASLSDGGEWMETGSDSGHTPNDQYHMDYPHSKYRHQEYGSYLVGLGARDSHSMPPVAQKKHHMFGKRFFQGEHTSEGSPPIVPHGSPAVPAPMPVKYEFTDTSRLGATGPVMNGSIASGIGVGGPSSVSAFTSPLEDDDVKPLEMKYSCSHEFSRQYPARPSMEHVAHNHSYHLPHPPASSGAVQRPLSRDKTKTKDSRKSDDAHLTRDEKRARALNVPLTVDDIINLPMDEFNERLSKHDLSEAQLSLIRDIRRRGKNKVAAQNCRKRKLDQIVSLADEVQQMRDRKQKLLCEHEYLLKECERAKDKLSQLYRHVFQSLRDADGNAYSPYEYSLQQAPEGSVVLVPRATSSASLLDQQSHSHPTAHSSGHSYPHMHPDRHKEHSQHTHNLHHPHSDPHRKE